MEAVSRAGATPLVRLSGVELRYPGAPADAPPTLAGVDLEVPRGGFVAVVGRSGCGKSTLLRLISGLLAPDRGRVEVGGAPVRGPLGTCGMAFQNASLLPWRTTLENVLLPLEVVRAKRRDYRRDRATYRERARDLLATVGLAGAEEKRPRELSGGMQQRVNLCRALVHEPELLLLDEPFGALDAFTREELWGVLERLRQQTGCTVVLITHDLTEAALLADAVVLMGGRPGRVLQRRAVPFAHPRPLELRYDPAFVELVAEIRRGLGDDGAADAPGSAAPAAVGAS